jgi:hypothetical protein
LHWVGYDVGVIEGEHAPRFAGRSSYSFGRSLNHAIESLSSQSNRPLQISIQFGFFLSFAAVSYAIWLAVGYYLFGVAVAGWTSVMVSMFFVSFQGGEAKPKLTKPPLYRGTILRINADSEIMTQVWPQVRPHTRLRCGAGPLNERPDMTTSHSVMRLCGLSLLV